MKCKNCGNEISVKDKFCNNCGYKINNDKIENKNFENVEIDKKKVITNISNKEILGDSKFCPECDYKIISQKNTKEIKNEIKSKISSNINLEEKDLKKYIKNIINAGKSVVALGWINIILLPMIYIFNITNPGEELSTEIVLVDIVFVFILGFIFIVYGNRIKEVKDQKIKKYINILLIISIIWTIFVMGMGGRVGFLLLIVIAYLLSAKNSFKKMERSNYEFKKIEYNMNKSKWILFSIISIILLFIALFIDIYS